MDKEQLRADIMGCLDHHRSLVYNEYIARWSGQAGPNSELERLAQAVREAHEMAEIVRDTHQVLRDVVEGTRDDLNEAYQYFNIANHKLSDFVLGKNQEERK